MKNISRKIGFTEAEFKIVFFISVVVLSGVLINYFWNSNSNNLTKFDYSQQDSLFNRYDSVKKEIELNKLEKKVASESKLLDFSKNNSKINKENYSKTNPLNINTATLVQLQNLPGIGEKTARAILKKREELNGFTKTKDLLKVKGIGKSKFKKIEKIIIIK